MTPGTIILLLAFLALVSTTAILTRGYVADNDQYLDYVKPLLGGAVVLLSSALLHLTYQFVRTDYSNAYVWHNTADYLGLLYRLTGVYAGNEGSILLWATIVSFVALAAVLFRGIDSRGGKLVQALTVGIVTYFTGMLLLRSPFAPVGNEFPNAPAGYVPTSGQGLNPLLVDPYMAIHPPVMFASYALLTMPFAIGAAHFISLLRGNGGLFSTWIGSVTRWLRLSWLFLTAAVALGGLWSYTVLGWGGIWAWDPVETAILIPWLFLTATLHAVTRYRPNGDYQILAPAMTATTFALAVYTTSVVRSGVFRSIHSFASGGIGVSLLVLMGITVVLGVIIPFGYWLFQDGDERQRDGEWITRSNLLHGAVLLLGLLTFVSLWGLTFPVLRDAITSIEVSVEPRYYNLWSFPFVIATMLLLGFYMDFDVEDRRRSLVGLGVFTAGTVVAAFVAPSDAWRLASTSPSGSFFYTIIGSVSALAVLPPVAYVCLSMLKRASVRIPAAAGRHAKLKETGITTIHIGVALLVLSLPLMYLLGGQASVMATGIGSGAVDSSKKPIAGTDYSIRVLGYSSSEFPRNPAVESYALSPRNIISRGESLNGTVQTVYGTVTNVRQGQRATVVQIDNSSVWVGLPNANESSVSVQQGQRIVAKGRLMWDFVPSADAMVLSRPSMMGSVQSPPESVVPTRVKAKGVSMAVYRGGNEVTSGVAGQRRYVQQGGMQVRDVIIDRGLISDTYVIVGVSDGTASVTVKRIPMMTVMRLAILMLLVGMSLVLLYDPAHGVRSNVRTRGSENAASTDTEPSD
ncbi:cytochrome c biogenesis protein CcsA [Halorussus halophilus]|uniref:cytochrome c biogenesis protein CcsA n=1 Tax=Halorussus halophilus TaxID=2650975 RepID=UPI0013014A8D|nr:cytochrome c biogenesis protein CcsA [Halorussus halophilus]